MRRLELYHTFNPEAPYNLQVHHNGEKMVADHTLRFNRAGRLPPRGAAVPPRFRD